MSHRNSAAVKDFSQLGDLVAGKVEAPVKKFVEAANEAGKAAQPKVEKKEAAKQPEADASKAKWYQNKTTQKVAAGVATVAVVAGLGFAAWSFFKPSAQA